MRCVPPYASRVWALRATAPEDGVPRPLLNRRNQQHCGKGASGPPRQVTTHAVLAQIDTIVTEMPERMRAMVLLAAWCAMRVGELAELRRGDINLGEGVVSITRGVSRVAGGHVVGDPKSDAGVRDVAIPPHILPAIKAHLKHVEAGIEAMVFPAKSGRHLQPSTFHRYYYKARATAGRDDLRFHDLRHTARRWPRRPEPHWQN